MSTTKPADSGQEPRKRNIQESLLNDYHTPPHLVDRGLIERYESVPIMRYYNSQIYKIFKNYSTEKRKK